MKVFRGTLAVLFIVSIFIFAGDAHASTWSLGAQKTVTAGTDPSFIIKADFNGDGIMDLAVCTRQNPGKVSIFLGTGDGKFKKKVTFNSGNKSVSMVAGDFNGDGIMDIAVANWGDDGVGPGNVTVFMGNGDGTFGSGTSYDVGTNPVYIVSADFNGDGYPDLAVANWGSGSVSVLMNNGDGTGTFQAHVDTAVGDHPRSIAAGDINNDGNIDLAVANWSDDTVSVLTGNGLGGFSSKTDYNVGGKPISVALGDLNGDGYLDIVAANFDTNNISLLLSDGAGGFKPTEFLATTSGPSFVTIKDFDGDGHADIITCNGTSNNVSVFLGFGDGTFQAKKDYPTGSYPAAAVLSDFNGDGAWDLATANFTSGTISVLLAKNKIQGDWTFTPSPVVTTTYPPASIFATDLDRDEFTDVVVVDPDPGNLDSKVLVYINNGKGGLVALQTLSMGVNSPVAVTADYLAGGVKKDIAVVSGNQVTIFKWSIADNQYEALAQTLTTGNAPVSIVSGIFSTSGKVDLAVCNSADGTVQIFHGDGTGAFTSVALSDVYTVGSNPRKIVVADFNGDGKLDLAVANNGSNNVSVLLGNGNGSFQAAVNYVAGATPVSLAAADFNADNKPDLAALNSDGHVSILLNNGNGTFKAPTNFTTGSNPVSVAAGDLNLDGKPDIVVAADDGLSVYFGKGAGAFSPWQPGPPVTALVSGVNGPVSVTISDFDKDGKADLAVASSTDSGVYVIEGADLVHLVTGVTGSGSVSPPTGDYEGCKTILFTATPDLGFYFKNWSGSLSGSDNPHQLLVALGMNNKTFTANFDTGPYISSLSNNTTPADINSGVLKDSVTITGSNFGTSKGTVAIGSASAKVTAWADTSITFTVPTNILYNKYKLHVTAGGKTSYSINFYILKAFITAADHTTASVGNPVVLTGENFGPDKVTVTLYPINGINGANATVTASANTSVTFTVPNLAAGTYIIKVKNAHGYSNGWPLGIN